MYASRGSVDQRRFVAALFRVLKDKRSERNFRDCDFGKRSAKDHGLMCGSDPSSFGVRRPVGAFARGGLTPLLPAKPRQVAADQSGDRSPHSKGRRLPYQVTPRLEKDYIKLPHARNYSALPLNIVCLATYFKGGDFIRECKRLGHT